MVEEKLPKEITAKKLELQTYEDVMNERNINNQYLNNLQNQVKVTLSHTRNVDYFVYDFHLIFRLIK